MNLVFVHGWAFSPDIWDDVRSHLGAFNHSMVDLGYFNNPTPSLEPHPEKAIYIGHSQGVQWCLKNAPSDCAGLVSISGFDRFLPHIPVKTIHRMQNGLARKADLQLALFYKQCGLKSPYKKYPISEEALMQGLESLAHLDYRQQKAALKIPITVLAAHNDAVVPPEMTKNIWEHHDIQWSPDGGHILPLLKPKWCANHIINLIENIKTLNPLDQNTS